MSPNAAEASAIIGSHVRGLAPSESTADWARLPEVPSSEEILSSEATSDDLPWFPLAKKWQKDEYLETLYKILRFEGIEGLRYSVRTLRFTPNMLDDNNTCVYTKVRTHLINTIAFLDCKLISVFPPGPCTGIRSRQDWSCGPNLHLDPARRRQDQLEAL